jgi:hypothetical protein
MRSNCLILLLPLTASLRGLSAAYRPISPITGMRSFGRALESLFTDETKKM